MPRPPDLQKLRANAIAAVGSCKQRFLRVEVSLPDAEYLLLRWIAAMTAVETHAIWERYAERRLIFELALSPYHLIAENGIRGLRRMPIGLAEVVVRGSGRFFDFRSFEDLMGRATKLVGKSKNPFATITPDARDHLDTLAAIRNFIVHQSDASMVAYRAALRRTYSIASIPKPEEFLNAKDLRKGHRLSGKKRILGLIEIVRSAIGST